MSFKGYDGLVGPFLESNHSGGSFGQMSLLR